MNRIFASLVGVVLITGATGALAQTGEVVFYGSGSAELTKALA